LVFLVFLVVRLSLGRFRGMALAPFVRRNIASEGAYAMAVELTPYVELRCPVCGSGPAAGSVRFDLEMAELSREPGEIFLIPRDPYEDQQLAVAFRCVQGHTVTIAAHFEGGAWRVAAESEPA
jgi:hypothetical protein